MHVRRTFDAEAVRAIITSSDVWPTWSQEGEALDYWSVDPGSCLCLELVDGPLVRGVVLATATSRIEFRARVAIPREQRGDRRNVQLGKLACAWIFATIHARKLTAEAPITNTAAIRYAQRVGFKREGYNRASFLREGRLLDQMRLGLVEARDSSVLTQRLPSTTLAAA